MPSAAVHFRISVKPILYNPSGVKDRQISTEKMFDRTELPQVHSQNLILKLITNYELQG
jgi:hypothetical protein